MQLNTCFFAIAVILLSCATSTQKDQSTKKNDSLKGTWKLLTGTIIENGDSVITDYTKGKEFIKIINDTHFAFFSHDVTKGKDSATAAFSAGAGSYELAGSLYTEHLAYCSDRQWEGNSFEFTVNIYNDTLTQSGVEKLENLRVDRINIEKYVRIKR